MDTLLDTLETECLPALDQDPSSFTTAEHRLKRCVAIVQFQRLLQEFPLPRNEVKSIHGYHLDTCVWSRDSCREGPQPCYCIPISLHFHRLRHPMPLPQKVVKSSHGFHLDTCVWSRDSCREGPDTCYCNKVWKNPLSCFIIKERHQVLLPDGKWHDKKCVEQVRCVCKAEE